MRNSIKTVTITGALALALSGCGIGGEPEPPTKTVTETATASPETRSGSSEGSAPASPSSSSSSPSSTSSGASQSVEVADFGQTFTYQDGMEVKVSEPQPYQPGQYAAGVEQHSNFVKFDVTVTNGTEQVYDVAMELMIAVGSSGGGGGTQVFDSGGALDDVMMAPKVLPGDSATFTVAFGVADPKDVNVQVTPTFNHHTAFFGGKA